MTAIRGSWTVDEAIAKHWENNNLDKTFRDTWPDPTVTRYEPLHDGEARPTPPGPYCVYEKFDPVILGHMTGARDEQTEMQFQDVTVQFTIHAKSSATESGKKIVRRLAEEVDKAFGPENALPIRDDCHIVTVRGPDFHIREGDEEWAWVLQYTLTIDCEYDTVA